MIESVLKDVRYATRVLGRAARQAVLGIGLGFAAALALSRVLATLVFGITVTDPVPRRVQNRSPR
jgi:hypothetical protein